MDQLIALTFMGKAAWMWALFIGLVVSLLLLDLGVLHKKEQAISMRNSLQQSAFYIAIAILFGFWVWYSIGPQQGKEYFTGFVIEKTLAMDNLFVISLIFQYFAIPDRLQYTVLFWGIIGVIVLRAILIGIGAVIVSQFEWVLYFFSAFLIFTGIKMLVIKEFNPDIENNSLLKYLKKHMNLTSQFHGKKFFVRLKSPETGKMTRYATPLFLALMLVEMMDLVFAIDSVPAIFNITQDPYIVYTSNIFAILGLRALYFALANMVDKFRYLKISLGVILIFIGSKIFVAKIMGIDKIPVSISLSVTMILLATGVIASMLIPVTSEKEPQKD